MIHRLSTLFVRTLRDDPAEAEVPSHRLLVRAGYIRRAAPGGYTWLPLGMRVLQKVEQVVREEMNAIGAQEVHFPALLPREPYDASGRWTDYGPNLFRLQDRRGVDYLLGPTHEEMFTLLVKDLYSSYKDLPVWLYQIQTKYRDEARPRAGLLRGREFVMKDSYSFDLDDDGLQRSYDAHRAAYKRVFERLGLDVVIVKAMSGAMGGSASEEFLAPCPSGEEVRDGDPCPNCGSAMRIDRGIEMGHVFQLGRKYAEVLGLSVLDEKGKQRVVTMGSYGIGVSRAVAAIAEASHDAIGLRWPRSVAPMHVHVVIAGKPGDETAPAAEKLAAELSAAGLDVLLDDREGVSPGVRFKDAELLGMPMIVIAGRGVAKGVLEVRDRIAGTTSEMPIADVARHVFSASA
ncbi:MAG: proline--tRNA ligase [Actinobacteria bacterium]|nr:proline--tRNA ligase [Actinomycetota bacterium]